MGGPSSEHDVSLQGGAKVVEALDPDRFDVRPVVIGRDGSWQVPPRATWRANGSAFDPGRIEGWKTYDGPLPALTHLKEWQADVVVPILHGRFGEDGTVQACLSAAGLTFVGSGSGASAIAIDKVRSKEIFVYHGLHTPVFEELDGERLARGVSATADDLVARHGTPLVIKEPCGGSSLEVVIADDAGEVAMAIQRLAPPATRLMVERYVKGRELTCGVILDRETREPIALPIVEIRPRKSRSFDYTEKYSPNGAEEICPAPIDADVEAEAKRIGLLVHHVLGCAGLSRTDFILDEEGRLQVLEVNTLPGMTDTSLVPRAAQAIGISFPALIETLIRTA